LVVPVFLIQQDASKNERATFEGGSTNAKLKARKLPSGLFSFVMLAIATGGLANIFRE
jgi:hypothetical protein